MSAINRFKEYFGMSPVASYEDEYLDEYERAVHHQARGERDRREDYGYREPGYRSAVGDERGYRREPVDFDGPEARPRGFREPAEPEYGRSVGVTRGSAALAPEEDFADDGLVSTPETVVERPRGFEDGKGLGENFRDGRAVVLDLSLMPFDDARRMSDFAAGLAFGLNGRMTKVTDRERTFLLQPAGLDLTEAEVRSAVNSAFRR